MSDNSSSVRCMEFPCTSDGIVTSQQFLEECLLNPKAGVIHDEIVSNIVRCSGAQTFSMSFVADGAGGTMTYSDAGKPFDPTSEIAEPDITASVEDRQIGGLGMFMVKRLAKAVAYRRNGDFNELAVTL